METDMADLVALRAANASRWAKAKLTRGSEFSRPAGIAFANKSRYLAIARRAGMPDIGWVFIAVSHYRESSQDFTKNLGQGDPLGKITTHVPADRGPFLGPSAFEDGAVDALVNCAPYAARLTDWTAAGMLTNLERYNGLGYANGPVTKKNGAVVARYPSQPSAYVWSGTDQYVRGKYVADGVFDPAAVDKQLGVAGLILALMQLDPTIVFSDAPAPQASVPASPAPSPNVPAPLDARWLQASLNALGATPVLIVDGINGPTTRTATRAFQTSKGMAVDGIAGPATIAAIKTALASPSASKPIVLPEIEVPAPGVVKTGLAPTFWGRFASMFKPKA
jgi:lysozyme family protein